MMVRVLASLAVVALATLATVTADLVTDFRPPAIPLFAFSPALHAWIRGDSLTDVSPSHWFIGQNSTLTGYISVDGTVYRWLGTDYISGPFIKYFGGDAGSDRPGTDVSVINMPNNATALDCAILCSLNQKCQQWSFSPYNSSSVCKNNQAACSLRAGDGTSKPDQCRTSGVAQVHWNSEYVTGIPSTDRPGSDLTDFDMAGDASPEDCAKACWNRDGCAAFVFAHRGCDDRQDRTHCWIKSNGTTAYKTNGCRQAGLGPVAAGWSAPHWKFAPTAVIEQKSVRVQPTQTIITFANNEVTLTVSFTQPAFADDQLQSSREHVYVTASVASNDGQTHKVHFYMDAASDLVASYPSSPNDAVAWRDDSNTLQRVNDHAHGYSMWVDGAKPFSFTGDSTRPNWGTLYFATDSKQYLSSTVATAQATRLAFINGNELPSFDKKMPVVSLGAAENTPVMAFVLDLSVNSDVSTSGVLTLFYDEGKAIEFFGTILYPYWTRQYGSPINALLAALYDYGVIKQRADTYDSLIITQMTTVVSDKYATLLSLLHRQVTGASITVWSEAKQSPWVFIKEMSTGGAMSTVDVLFPGSPFYFALAPETMKLMLWPIMSWSNNETSNKVTISWAPHDFGGYPIANSDAANQEEMPVEESGNMLLMLAAIAQRQNGDVSWLVPYQMILGEWAAFINSTMPDPGDQLCTDDFEGPSPHNANLAVKGIVGLNAYAILLRYFGRFNEASQWDTVARQYAEDWKTLALDYDSSKAPHFKQRYDQNQTWSTKYNLIFQYMLGTDAFTDDVRTTENAFYQTQANQFGIPLDNRHSYQKSDWFSWGGSLAFDNAKQQSAIIDFLYNFANTSPDRQPFSDLFDTETNLLPGGFIARFVMGGLYAIPILNLASEGYWPGLNAQDHDHVQGLELLNGAFPSSKPSAPVTQVARY